MATQTIYTSYTGSTALTNIEIDYTYSQNISDNTTTITAAAYWKKLHSSAYGYRQTPQTFSLTVGGNTKTLAWTFNLGNYGVGARGHILTHTRTISHGSDGSLAAVGISAYCATGTTTFGTINGSMRMSIPTIPRASTFGGVLSGTIGSSANFGIQRASSVFSHTVDYTFGSKSGEVSAKTSASSITWNIPATLAEVIPKATSGTARITLKTYNGNTLIGQNTYNMTLYIPSSMKPVITSIGATLHQGLGGYYVQGRSHVDISINSSQAYNSPIVSARTSVTGAGTSNGLSFRSGVLSASGTVTISSTVTDARGQTSEAVSKTITVEAYAAPKVDSLKVYRVNSNGTENSSGNYIRIIASGVVSSAGGANAARKLVVEYRQTGASSWTPITNTNAISYAPSFDKVQAATADKSYEVRVTLSDYYSTHSQTAEVGTGFTLMDFHAGGKGMAIGKVAEGRGVLDISGSVYINDEKPMGKDNSLGTNSLNNIKNTGHYYGYQQTGGAVSGISNFLVQEYSPDWVTQIQSRVGAAADTYIRNFYNGNTWGAWHKLFHSGNNGGLDIGSNENGHWVRFPDGTQICYFMRTTVYVTGIARNESPNNSGYYADINWTLPAGFMGDCTAFVTGRVYNENQAKVYANLRVDYNRATVVGVRLSDRDNITSVENFSVAAIGRWK